MKQISLHYAIILAVSVSVFFTNLGKPLLWDRDEPRNAGCAEEMMARGDWVVPMFNDQLRDAKPILLYWLIMLAYESFGFNEFAARFWSATLAVGTVFATYHIGRRLFRPQVGLWAAVILTTTLMFDVAARAATPDSPLIFLSTLAVLIYVLGTFGPSDDQDTSDVAPQLRRNNHFFPTWPLACLMYGVMALGFLAKGPVGLILPTAVIGMSLLIQRLPTAHQSMPKADNWRDTLRRFTRTIFRCFRPTHFLNTCWSMRPLTALGVLFLIAGPWYLLVGLRTNGDFLYGFFLQEHFGRATTSFENHNGFFMFYPVAILVGCFPWSIFAIPVVLDTLRRLQQKHVWASGITLLACWIGVYVSLFSLAQTKLPSYVTPCYPAVALLLAIFLVQWVQRQSLAADFWPRISFSVLILVGIGMAIGVGVAARLLLPGEELLATVGIIPFLGGLVGLILVLRAERAAATFVMAATAIALTTAMFGFAAPRVSTHQQNVALFELIRRQSQNPQIASYGVLESTWVYYAKQPIHELLLDLEPNPRDSSTLLRRHPWARRPQRTLREFLQDSPAAYLITTKTLAPQLRQVEPDLEVVASVPFFLRDEELVLLASPPQTSPNEIGARSDRSQYR